MSEIDKLKEFNKAFKINCPSEPEIPDPGNNFALQRAAETMEETAINLKEFAASVGSPSILRLQLIQEELSELAYAILDRDKVEVLDALTDLLFVVNGAFLTFGMGDIKEAAFDEVFSSNMSKLDDDGEPLIHESGRVMKSNNYFAPNLKKIIEGEA